MALAYPILQRDARESIACDCFLDALDDPDLALKIREKAPADLDEELTTAMRLEAWAAPDQIPSRYNQLTQRPNVLDNQIAELWKLHAETAMNEPRPEGATTKRPQDIPTVRTGVFQASRPNLYRERESTMVWPRKRASSEHLVC